MKNRFKKPIILAAFLLFAATELFSQCPAGIYLSGSDYKAEHISYTKTGNKNISIRINEVIYRSFVKIVNGDSIVKLEKKNIFGYKNNQGASFRFFKGDVYPIMNSQKDIILYKITPVQSKGMTKKDEWYFSKDANSDVLPLTMDNLKTAFTDNASFLKILETSFRDNDALIEYDTYYKEYKINRLFEMSKTK